MKLNQWTCIMPHHSQAEIGLLAEVRYGLAVIASVSFSCHYYCMDSALQHFPLYSTGQQVHHPLLIMPFASVIAACSLGQHVHEQCCA